MLTRSLPLLLPPPQHHPTTLPPLHTLHTLHTLKVEFGADLGGDKEGWGGNGLGGIGGTGGGPGNANYFTISRNVTTPEQTRLFTAFGKLTLYADERCTVYGQRSLSGLFKPFWCVVCTAVFDTIHLRTDTQTHTHTHMRVHVLDERLALGHINITLACYSMLCLHRLQRRGGRPVHY